MYAELLQLYSEASQHKKDEVVRLGYSVRSLVMSMLDKTKAITPQEYDTMCSHRHGEECPAQLSSQKISGNLKRKNNVCSFQVAADFLA